MNFQIVYVIAWIVKYFIVYDHYFYKMPFN